MGSSGPPPARGAYGQDRDGHSSTAQQGSGGRAAVGRNEESRALTQHQHLLELGRMQESAASASPALPKREAKVLQCSETGRSRRQRNACAFVLMLQLQLMGQMLSAAVPCGKTCHFLLGSCGSFSPTLWDHQPTPRVPTKPQSMLWPLGAALPVLCGELVLRHHLWHVDGRVRWPRHGEGRLLPLLLQRLGARGGPVSGPWPGGARRGRRGQRWPGLRGGHRRGGRR